MYAFVEYLQRIAREIFYAVFFDPRVFDEKNIKRFSLPNVNPRLPCSKIEKQLGIVGMDDSPVFDGNPDYFNRTEPPSIDRRLARLKERDKKWEPILEEWSKLP